MQTHTGAAIKLRECKNVVRLQPLELSFHYWDFWPELRFG